MAKKIKLHHILFLGFTLISAVPVILLALWVQSSALDNEITAVEDKHLLLARNLTGALSRYALDVESGFRLALGQLQAGHSPGRLPEHLASLGLKHVCIVDESGRILKVIPVTGEPPTAEFVSPLLAGLQAELAAARAKPGKVTFSNVMPNSRGKPSLYLLQALGAGRLGLAELGTEYLVAVQKAIAFGEKGHAAIVDRAGRVLAHPNAAWREQMKDISAVRPVREMMRGGTGVAKFYSPATKSDMIAGYTTVPNVGWGVMIPQPYSELLQRAEEVRKVALGITILGIALAGFIGWWLARYLAWPIRAVVESAHEVAGGKLTARVPDAPRFAPLELRQLFDSFNRMVNQVAANTERLQAISARLADAQRIARLGNWEWDIHGNSLWWSEEANRILQREPGERRMKYEVFQESVHPDDRERVIAAIDLALQERKPFELEHRVLLPDGSERILHQQAEVHLDASGEPERMSGTLHDVTDLRRMAALQESEARFRSLVGQAADAFFLHDGAGRIVDVNMKACESVGYAREELLALSMSDLFDAAQDTPFADIVQSVAPGNPAMFLGQQRQKDGASFPVEVRIGTIEAGGQRLFLAVARDITERKRLEDRLLQTQKLEAIGTLAGGIAHDFNNLLFPIIGFTELTMEKLPPDSREHADLKMVLGAAFRARDIVSQVLLFGRKSTGSHDYFDLKSLVSEAVSFLGTSLPKTIAIREEITSDAAVVNGDPTQIHQVLINVCVNAAQAMESGGVLGVNLERLELDGFETSMGNRISGPYLRLAVSDAGTGMDEETMTHMFEPFFTTKPVGEGTGLGLSAVLGVVEQHKGALNVISSPGEGTNFEIYLKAESAAQAKPRPKAAGKPQGSESILLVDDEAAAALVGQRVLESYGYSVTAVTSGREAMEVFEKRAADFHLVITDQTMSGMSGEKLVGNLRRIRGDIPIIMCTGYSDSITKEKMKTLGIDGFFYKPIEPEGMGNIVRQVLEQSTAPAGEISQTLNGE